MSKFLTGVVVFQLLMVFAFAVKAQEVPKSIPTLRILDAYLSFQAEANNKAFFISENGGWGHSRGYGTKDEALKGAMESCNSHAGDKKCILIDVNGEMRGSLVKAEVLRASLNAAQAKVWPQPEGKIPQELEEKERQLDSYLQYLQKTGFKAFAMAEDGAWAYTTGHESDLIAQTIAMRDCKKYTKLKENCKLIDTNNQAVTAWVAFEPRPELVNPDSGLIPVSIKTHAQWELYLRYLNTPKAHRAFAVSGWMHYGWATKEASVASAQIAAKADCKYNYKIECKVIAQNSQLLEKTVPSSSLLPAPSVTNVELPEKIVRRLGSAWGRYKAGKGHRALAMNSYGVAQEAKDFLRVDDAVTAALELCNGMRVGASSGDEKAECRIILINDQVQEAVVKQFLSAL